MAMHNTEQYSGLFLPATDEMLHGFANSLSNTARKFGSPFEDMYRVDLSLHVSYGNDEGGALKFIFTENNDEQEMSLTYSRAVPINKTWSKEAAKLVLGNSYENINGVDIDDDTFDGQEADEDEDDVIIDSYDQDDEEYYSKFGDVEGYVEHETKLGIKREGRYIDSYKSVIFNFLDSDDDQVGIDTLHARWIDVPLTFALQQDVERLYRFGETTLDFESNEDILSLPSAADLIVGMHALIGSGISPKKTRAYKGAPTYLEIAQYLPRLYV